MSQLTGNALVGQSGGPTCVINQSLVGVIEGCLAAEAITGVYGTLQGIQGVLDEDFVDLAQESAENLERVANAPCAALRSIRKKPTREDCETMLGVFERYNIRFFFYIGGNDSAETAHLLNEVAVERGYEIRLFHVPKTIDNDLRVNDHTPGYGSAARFVIQALMGDNLDNYSLGGIKINVIMGRNAGWLTAAARLARHPDDDGPHLIYVPEADFSMEEFLTSVEARYRESGRCLVAVSEGIHFADGTLVAAGKGADAFGNVQLSGSGSLGDLLSAEVKGALGKSARVRADTFGYLQRSYLGVVSEQDAFEAREVGRHAVRVAAAGDVPHGSVVILRDSEGGKYKPRFDVTELKNVARDTQELPDDFVLGANDIAPAFIDYCAPLVGPIPAPGRLAGVAVPKRP